MAESNNIWDELGKALLVELLEPLGTVAREYELAGHPLRADVAFFEPDDGLNPSELGWRGLLESLVAGCCVFEPYSARPNAVAMRRVVRKAQLWLERIQARRERLEARDTDSAQREPGLLWLLVPWPSPTLVERFGFEADGGTPGLYRSASGYQLGLVVISELPVRRDTLLLRLMGRGKILEQAWRELNALPEDAPERRLLAVMSRFARVIREAAGRGELEIDESEQEIWMNAQQWLEQEKKQSQREGEQGLLQRQFALRLGRALTERETATLAAQLAAGESETLSRLVLECDADALAAWLDEHDAG